MADLPAELEIKLADPAYQRRDRARVEEAVGALGVVVPEAFRLFFERYEGPFSSERTGFGLLDLCEPEVNIVQATGTCREEFGWPDRFVVLTELLGNAVLALDTEQDRVFNVDFEGGDELLIAGELQSTWSSFADFLRFYFA